MVGRVQVAEVMLWKNRVGAVAWNDDGEYATFEFEPHFLETGLDIAPFMMPLDQVQAGRTRYEFRTLSRNTFYGLPGLLSDSLPDRFGNVLIDRWISEQGRKINDFGVIERLCYTGKRGMGALEYRPAIRHQLARSVPVEIEELTRLAQQVIDERAGLKTGFQEDTTHAMLNIIRVGTSAGGNRPKAVIAYNDKTKKVRSGQVKAPDGFDYWLIKFDGVQDDSLGDPKGFCRIEYGYYLMAQKAGIHMMESRLLEEGDRAHFMTRRFDRPDGNTKLHVQTLCGMAHFNFNAAGAYSYEQAFQVMRQLRLPYTDAEQQYRRMVFNIIARNQDDHTKNIAFIMDEQGRWRLSPAYDVTYAYNPHGLWTAMHQMSVQGKQDGFTRQDLLAVGKEMNIKNAGQIIEQILDAVADWPRIAKEAAVEKTQIDQIGRTHRMSI